MVFSLEQMEEVHKNQKQELADGKKEYLEYLDRYQRITEVPNTPYCKKLQRATGESIRIEYEWQSYLVRVDKISIVKNLKTLSIP